MYIHIYIYIYIYTYIYIYIYIERERERFIIGKDNAAACRTTPAADAWPHHSRSWRSSTFVVIMLLFVVAIICRCSVIIWFVMLYYSLYTFCLLILLCLLFSVVVCFATRLSVLIFVVVLLLSALSCSLCVFAVCVFLFMSCLVPEELHLCGRPGGRAATLKCTHGSFPIGLISNCIPA